MPAVADNLAALPRRRWSGSEPGKMQMPADLNVGASAVIMPRQTLASSTARLYPTSHRVRVARFWRVL